MIHLHIRHSSFDHHLSREEQNEEKEEKEEEEEEEGEEEEEEEFIRWDWRL